MVPRRKIWLVAIISNVLITLAVYSLFMRSKHTHVLERDAYHHRHFKGWVKPHVYRFGDPVELLVNKATSDSSPETPAYYDLPFVCPPTKNKKPIHSSLLQVLRGDAIAQSDYQLKFGYDDDCQTLCARKTTRQGIQKAIDLISENYSVQWMIDDDLPGSTTYISTTDHKKKYVPGFPLGHVDPQTGDTLLNNHVMLVIRYNAIDDDKFTIVGFEIYPKSVSDYHCPGAARDYDNYKVTVPDEELTFIPFTYSVYWREEFAMTWQQKWDLFLSIESVAGDEVLRFHWLSLVYIMTIILFLLSGIALFTYRNTRKAHNNALGDASKNWIHTGYLEASSPNMLVLNALTAMGLQSIGCIFALITALASRAVLHNMNDLLLAIITIFILVSTISASCVGTWLRLDTFLRNSVTYNSKFAIICSSLLPMISTFVVIITNYIIWLLDSTSQFPFKSFTISCVIFTIASVPLGLIGGPIATKLYPKYRDMIFTARANYYTDDEKKSAYRPTQRNSFLLVARSITSGIIPFAFLLVEIYYVKRRIQSEKASFFYCYLYILLTAVLQCTIVALVSIVGCYLLLKRNSGYNSGYNWRWKCFQLGCSSAFYMELYSIYYYLWRLKLRGPVPVVSSIVYCTISNCLYGLAMGALGYLASCWFVNKLYRSSFG